MLGDHQIVFQTNLLIDLKKQRLWAFVLLFAGTHRLGIQAFIMQSFLSRFTELFFDTLYRFRTWGVGAIASYRSIGSTALISR